MEQNTGGPSILIIGGSLNMTSSTI